MAASLIPIDQLTNAEVEFYIQKGAENVAWELYPNDPIYRENDIKKRKVRIRAELLEMVDDVKQGKVRMPEVDPASCGRDPNVRMRSPKGFGFKPEMIDPIYWNLKEKWPYTDGQLNRLGFLDDPGISLLNLDPDISKIIAPFDLDHWFLSPTQAQVFDPVLRLASRLLMSPPSVKFLHALMFNPRLPEDTACRIWGRDDLDEVHYNHSQDKATVELAAPVMQELTKLSKRLTWSLFDCTAPPYALSREKTIVIDGITAYCNEDNGADIFIDARFVQSLEHFSRQANRSSQSICSALRFRLYAATVLCHELCHAISSCATVGKKDSEPFFMNYSCIEVGFTWEQEVFGGVLNWGFAGTHEEKEQAPLGIDKWPTVTEFGDYFYDPDPTKYGSIIRRYPKGSTTRYFIWMQWVESLFRDENWAKVMAEDKLDCLRPPKSFGYRVVSGRPDLLDLDWRRSQSSEALEQDGKSRVWRNPWMRLQLTPSPPDSP